MTLAEGLMVLVYWLLVVAWVGTTLLTPYIWFREPSFRRVWSYRLIGAALTGVSFVLLVDSVYWALVNSYGVGATSIYVPRNPAVISVIKGALLLASASFLFVVYAYSRPTAEALEAGYFDEFVNRTWDAVGILDSEGRVKYWNKGAENLFGFDRKDVVGQRVVDFLVPSDRREEFLKVAGEIRDTRRARQDYETERMTASGSRIRIEVSMSPIIGDGFLGYFGIMRPVQRTSTPGSTARALVVHSAPADGEAQSVAESIGEGRSVHFSYARMPVDATSLSDVNERIRKSDLVLIEATSFSHFCLLTLGFAISHRCETVVIAPKRLAAIRQLGIIQASSWDQACKEVLAGSSVV